MRTFVLSLYNEAKKGVFPIKSKTVSFDTYSQAMQYCTKLNKKLKSESYWAVSQIGIPF
jgi:hypothetical protein